MKQTNFKSIVHCASSIVHSFKSLTLLLVLMLGVGNVWGAALTTSELNWGTPFVSADFNAVNSTSANGKAGSTTTVTNATSFGPFTHYYFGKNANCSIAVVDVASPMTSKFFRLSATTNVATTSFNKTFGTTGAFSFIIDKNSKGYIGLYNATSSDNTSYAKANGSVYLYFTGSKIQINKGNVSGNWQDVLTSLPSTDLIEVTVVYNNTTQAATYGNNQSLGAKSAHVFINGARVETSGSAKSFTIPGASLGSFRMSYNNSGTINIDDIKIYDALPTAASSKTIVTLTAGNNGSVKAYSDETRQTELTVDANNQFEVNQNTTVYFTATPSSSAYVVDTWTGATADAQDKTKASLDVGTDATKTVSVSFNEIQYNITENLTNVTAKSGDTHPTKIAATAEDLTLNYTAASGYTLPASITVQMGSTTLVDNDTYTWNNSTGELWITGAFTGDIAITIAGVAAPTDVYGIKAYFDGGAEDEYKNFAVNGSTGRYELTYTLPANHKMFWVGTTKWDDTFSDNWQFGGRFQFGNGTNIYLGECAAVTLYIDPSKKTESKSNLDIKADFTYQVAFKSGSAGDAWTHLPFALVDAETTKYETEVVTIDGAYFDGNWDYYVGAKKADGTTFIPGKSHKGTYGGQDQANYLLKEMAGLNANKGNVKGKFRIWANSTERNWYCTFVPVYSYVLMNTDKETAFYSSDEVSSEAASLATTIYSTTPTRDNYMFLGWSRTPDKSTFDEQNDVAAGGAYTYWKYKDVFYPIWGEIPSHNVTWSVNGVTSSVSYKEGAAITFTAPTTNIPDGYAFRGWYNDNYSNETVEPTYITSANMGTSDITYYAVFGKIGEPTSSSWSETPLASLTSSDVFVFSNGSYAMTNNNGTSSAPAAVSITVSKGNITSEVTDVMKWNVGGNGTDGYTFYPNGSTTTWLYCNTETESGSNNNLRVGTGSRKIWELSGDNLKTKDDKKTRYISIYNSADFRGYVNTDLAITPKFYKAIAGGPSYSNFTTSVKVKTALATPTNLASTAISKGANLSWTKVDHAASYKVEYTGDLETWSVADVSFTTVENTVSCTVNLNPCAGYYWRVTALAATDDPDYKDGVATEGEDYFSTLGYNVTVTVNNVVEDNSNAYKSTNSPKAFDCSETGIALGYTASNGYVLPSDVTVTIGGTPQVKGTGYTWVVEDGMALLSVEKSKLTGALTISITGESNNPATVTFNAGNGICDTDELTESSKGAGITLPTATPSEKCAALGWEFAGWSTTQQAEATTTSPTILPAGLYKPAGDINLYAVYKYTEAGSTEWIRATKVSDVTVGGTFILGYEADYTNNKGVIVPMRNEGTITGDKGGYIYSGITAGSSTNGTINMSTVDATSAFEVSIVASTSVIGDVALKIGNKFIGNENASASKLYDEQSVRTAFHVSVGENDVVTLSISANVEGHNTDYTELKYNPSSGAERFAIYKNGGTTKAGVLYKKKVNSVTTYIASPECSSTAITLDKGTQGQANGSAVAQKGSKNLAGFTGVTLEVENSYVLNGYYSAEEAGVKVIDAEGKLVANVTDYTNANGEWTRDDEEVTLYAQWTANTFDITLNKNSSAATGSGSAKVTYGAEEVTNFSSNIERTGYTITGFKGGSVIVLNADGTFASNNVAEYIENGKWIKVGNVALDAQWQGEAVELSFNDNGTITPVQTNVGTKIQLPDLAKGCAGYSNVGWTTTAPENNGWTTKPAIKQGGSNYTVESGVTTFYAVYSEGTGDPNLFEKVETASDFTEDGTYMLVWNDEQTSKFFAMGNNFDSEENTWATTEVSVSDNQISNTNNAYCWTFKNNNADKYSMKNVGDNSYVVCNSDKHFEASATAGYTFAISFSNGVVTLSSADCEEDLYGWQTNAFLSGRIDNITYDEVFGLNMMEDTKDNYLFKQTGSTSYISNPDCREISSITIADESTAETEYYTDETFNPAGLVIQINYTSGEPKTVTYSQSIADDFTFSPALTEYLKTSDKQEKITYGGFDAYLDITVTVRPSYTVTYDMNGRSGVAPTEVPQYEGTQITIKAAPEVSGQYFGGWKASTDGEIYNAGDHYIMTADNVVFTAQWTTAFIYKKITDASTLMDGDQIIIANYSEGIAMGAYNSSNYFDPAQLTFIDESTTTTVTNNVKVFTLVATSNNKWKLKTADGQYLSDGSKKLYLGDTQTEWSITISSGSASVSASNGPIKYNSGNSALRYACYTSTASEMKVPSIYRKLAYTRAASKFSNGTISTVCLPYGVCQGDFYGCTVYEITGKELQGGDPYKVFFDQVFSMEAGKPYVVELDENATEAKFFYSGTAVDEPNNSNTNGLIGTFEAIDDLTEETPVLKDNYMIYSNQIKKCGTGCLVGANKAYIKMDAVPLENGTSAAPGRRLTLGVEQAHTPTNLINNLGETKLGEPQKVIINNQMFIIRGGKMYNAAGALVK